MSETKPDPRPNSGADPSENAPDKGRSSLDRLAEFTRHLIRVPVEEVRERAEREKRLR
jgi:hypothetical protein